MQSVGIAGSAIKVMKKSFWVRLSQDRSARVPNVPTLLAHLEWTLGITVAYWGHSMRERCPCIAQSTHQRRWQRCSVTASTSGRGRRLWSTRRSVSCRSPFQRARRRLKSFDCMLSDSRAGDLRAHHNTSSPVSVMVRRLQWTARLHTKALARLLVLLPRSATGAGTSTITSTPTPTRSQPGRPPRSQRWLSRLSRALVRPEAVSQSKKCA